MSKSSMSADTMKFPSREIFAETVLKGWNHCGVRILQWVVSMEAHADSGVALCKISNMYHYHMALKLSK